LELSGVKFRYPGCEEAVFSDLDLSVLERSRIAVAGRNGAGKSTLVKILTGNLEPEEGEFTRHRNLRIAYFGQHDAAMLQSRDATPADYIQECFPKMREPEILEQLLAFGVTRNMMFEPMFVLSGGQRMRIAFARMCAEEPHLLVLDEPTNYLDRDSLGALALGLQDFGGGVVIISHNMEFTNSICTEKWFMDAGRLTREGEVVGDDEALNADPSGGADEIIDGAGNVIKIDRQKTMSDKERKKAIKEIEKKLKEHKKKNTLSDAEMWELQDKLAELSAQLGG